MSGPFEPGDVVVCVDAQPWADDLCIKQAFRRLSVGKAYRVARVGEDWCGNVGIDIGVPNRDLFDGFADIWPPRCFRKIDDEVTDEFREQLRKLPVLEHAL